MHTHNNSRPTAARSFVRSLAGILLSVASLATVIPATGASATGANAPETVRAGTPGLPQNAPAPASSLRTIKVAALASAAEGFTWSAPDRARQWAANWRAAGVTKAWSSETYNPNYVSPTSWPLSFNGCQTQAELDLSKAGKPTINTYSWTSSGSTVPLIAKKCLVNISFAAQGAHHVALTMTKPNGAVSKWTQPVRVQDKLIVVLGDSFASGEGAPDKPITAAVHRQLGYDYDNATWVDRRCHRSSLAGPIQAAYQLEDLDPHTSVTVISFACSGATISKVRERGAGVLAPYKGIVPVGTTSLTPQVDQLAQAVAMGRKRTIDSMIVMAGINDMRFSDMMEECLLHDDCWNEEVAAGVTLQARTLADITALANGYAKIRDALATRGVKYSKAFNVEYPSPLNNWNGLLCNEILGDVIPGFSVEAPDIKWMDTTIRPKFFAAIKNSAVAGGFAQITGVNSRFAKAGYCVSDSTRLINTAAEASNWQGPYTETKEGFGLRIRSTGTSHPNAKGQLAVAAAIVTAIRPRFEVKAPVGKADAYTVAEDKGIVKLAGTGGVLDNDTDPAALPLSAYGAWVTTGKLTVGPTGVFGYTPPANFNGTVNFGYVVSNGMKATPVTGTITVTPVADAIVAVNDIVNMFGPQSKMVVVSANDINPDKRPITITVTGVNPAIGATIYPIGTDSVWVQMPYTAVAFTTSFTYTVHDGVKVSTATVTVNVKPNLP